MSVRTRDERHTVTVTGDGALTVTSVPSTRVVEVGGPQGPPGGGMTNPMTAAGDLIAGGAAGAAIRLPAGQPGMAPATTASGVLGWVPIWEAVTPPATIVLDPTAGNDSTGTGSWANPYQTLAKAQTLEIDGAGLTVLLKPGTYGHAATHQPTASGTREAPIAYRAVAAGVIWEGTAALANAAKVSLYRLRHRRYHGIRFTQVQKGTGNLDQMVKAEECHGIRFVGCLANRAYHSLVRPIQCRDFLWDGGELYDVDLFAAWDCVRGAFVWLANATIRDWGATGNGTVAGFIKGGVRTSGFVNVECHSPRDGAGYGLILGGSSDAAYAWHPTGGYQADGTHSGTDGWEAYNCLAVNCAVQRNASYPLYAGYSFQGSTDCAILNSVYHGNGTANAGTGTRPIVAESGGGGPPRGGRPTSATRTRASATSSSTPRRARPGSTSRPSRAATGTTSSGTPTAGRRRRRRRPAGPSGRPATPATRCSSTRRGATGGRPGRRRRGGTRGPPTCRWATTASRWPTACCSTATASDASGRGTSASTRKRAARWGWRVTGTESMLAAAVAALFGFCTWLIRAWIEDLRAQRDAALKELRENNTALAELLAIVKALPGERNP